MLGLGSFNSGPFGKLIDAVMNDLPSLMKSRWMNGQVLLLGRLWITRNKLVVAFTPIVDKEG